MYCVEMDVNELKRMSNADVSTMLSGKGIPEKFYKAFEGKFIAAGFQSLTGVAEGSF